MLQRPLLLVVTFSLAWSGLAHATEPMCVHGDALAAKALGGHQQRELGFGTQGAASFELRLAPPVGVEVQAVGVWLADGKAPKDETLADGDAATAGGGGLGVRVLPFARPDAPLGGLWTSLGTGAVQTGGLTRAYLRGELGYDVPLRRGPIALGPAFTYLHVFQPDRELRPADAHVISLGLHVVYGFGLEREEGPKDTDGDGILDPVDRCPLVPEDKDGFEDSDGCPDPDNDRDGILDPVDRCPLVPEDKDRFEDEDGCPDPDNDRDGLLDPVDKCPREPEDKDGFEDEDGCPDPDNDQDGIPDTEDLCPNEPETVNGYADADGCPDEDQVRVVGDKIVLDEKVHFRINNATIRPLSYPLLERLAKLLREHPEYIHVHIEGHADQVGDAKFNQQLSEDRARSVLEFLVKSGVDASRLSSEGFGESAPRIDQRDEHSRFLNRRVEFRVTRAVSVAAGNPATPGPAAPAAPAEKAPEAPPAKSPDSGSTSGQAGESTDSKGSTQ